MDAPKVRFKSNTTREGMNNFLLVDGAEDTYTYMPMNTFTTVDLHYFSFSHYPRFINRVKLFGKDILIFMLDVELHLFTS